MVGQIDCHISKGIAGYVKRKRQTRCRPANKRRIKCTILPSKIVHFIVLSMLYY